MARRDYTGNAIATTITAGINSSDLAIAIAASTGWPSGGASGKFYVTINRGEADEERVLVESRTGLNLTVAAVGDRGVDDTTAQSHASGATIEHTFSAVDADEANAHVWDDTRDDHSQYLNAARHTAAHADENAVGLIGLTVHNGPENITTSSATFADVDATDLDVAFVAPTSGSVVVHLTGYAVCGISTLQYRWGLREGAVDIGTPWSVMVSDDAGATNRSGVVTAKFNITGLTPGNTYTYKWSHARTNGGTSQINIGSSGFAAPAVMEVFVAP